MSWQNRLAKAKALPKYKNEKVAGLCHYGFSHRSKLERAVCDIIRLRELAGELKHLAHEDRLYLSKARYPYIADFKCEDAQGVFWIEAKGTSDGRWPSTKKMWRAYGFGRLEVWMGGHRKPSLVKTIVTDLAEETITPAQSTKYPQPERDPR